jgi:hypothetical protein
VRATASPAAIGAKKNEIANAKPQAAARTPALHPPASPGGGAPDDVDRPVVSNAAENRPPAEPGAAGQAEVPSAARLVAEATSPNANRASAGNGPVLVDAASAEGVWRRALECVTGFVGEFAATATKISADDQGRLIVSFPESQKFNRDTCLRPANLSKLDAALEQVCGGRVGMTLVTHPDPVGSAPAAPAARPNPKQQHAEVAADPFVMRAVELFDGDPERLRISAPRVEGSN